jgi:superfamily II DNA/RNA helicase
LIATNVLARGIDVPEVDLVISYDVPTVKKFGWIDPDYANFMHRTGRTGRYGTDGLSVTCMVPDEAKHEEDMMVKIEEHYKFPIEELKNFDNLI